MVKTKFLRLRNLLLLKTYIICFDKSDRFPLNGGERCGFAPVLQWSVGTDAELSMAVTARVIWLCACVRYWPYTAELVVRAAQHYLTSQAETWKNYQLLLKMQSGYRRGLLFVNRLLLSRPGKSCLKKEVVLQKTDPVFYQVWFLIYYHQTTIS